MIQTITPERAEASRTGDHPGGYTFNLFPDPHYEGDCIVLAVLRLGDHAHVDVSSGRHVPQHPFETGVGVNIRRGEAGHLILRWHEWLMLRDALAEREGYRIAEVERPTTGQLITHSPTAAVLLRLGSDLPAVLAAAEYGYHALMARNVHEGKGDTEQSGAWAEAVEAVRFVWEDSGIEPVLEGR